MRSDQDYQRSVLGEVREGRLHAAGHGAAIFLAFVAAGSVPLLPYVLMPGCATFVASCLFTGATLFGVGSLRTVVTRARWFVSGLEMLLIGSAAAVVAYAMGYGLRHIQ